MTPLSGQDTDGDLSVTGVGHTCGVGLPEFVTAFPQCMCLVPRIVIVGLHKTFLTQGYMLWVFRMQGNYVWCSMQCLFEDLY